MKNILRLNMEVCDKWDMILIKQNENFLARNSSVSFMFDNGDTIYICGGKDNLDQETEYICEYHINSKTVKVSISKIYFFCIWKVKNYVSCIISRVNIIT